MSRNLNPGDLAVVIKGSGGANNVRVKPDTGSTVKGQIQENAVLEILPKPAHWTQGYPHKEGTRVWWYGRGYDEDKKKVVDGWIAEKEGTTLYLEQLGAIESCNSATAEVPGMRWRPSNLKTGMQAYVVSKAVLNVRAGPGCDTADEGDLAPGTVITVLEGPRCSTDGRVWCRIKYNGKDRWVCENEPAGTVCGSDPTKADPNQIDWNLLPLRVALPAD
jgi:uncharacterized protein YgiM (DUF1202 family)